MSYEGGGGNASAWSTFPATQGVIVTGFNLDVDTITGLGENMVTLSATGIDGNNFLTLDGNIIGAQGPTGVTGSQILYGSTVPGVTGAVNDTYINTTNGDVYSKTSSTEWNPTSSSSLAWKSVASDSTGQLLVACISNGKIWASDNTGGIWIETSATTQEWSSITSDSNGQNLAACAYGGEIWYSLNYGSTWTASNAPSPSNWTSIASNLYGDKLVACIAGGGIYYSINYGSTWTASSASNQSWSSVASDSSGNNLVACVNGAGIYTSNNGGADWVETSAPTSTWTSVASGSDGQFLVACISYGTIRRSVDGGLNWTETGSPPNSWSSVKCTPDESKLIASVEDGGIWTSIDAGATWVESDAPSLSWKSVTTDSTGTKLVACASGEPIYTTSGGGWTLELNITGPTGVTGATGATFSYIGTWIEGSYAVNTLAVDPTDNNTYVCIVQTEPPDLDDPPSTLPANWTLFANGGPTGATGSAPQVYQATYYKSAAQNLSSGATDITFGLTGEWNNPGTYITHTDGTKDFTVGVTGLYQMEFNAFINANGASWDSLTNKNVAIDITRGGSEHAVIANTALQASAGGVGVNYAQCVTATYYLLFGDVINLRVANTFTGGPPSAEGLLNTFDLNTFFTWRFIS